EVLDERVDAGADHRADDDAPVAAEPDSGCEPAQRRDDHHEEQDDDDGVALVSRYGAIHRVNLSRIGDFDTPRAATQSDRTVLIDSFDSIKTARGAARRWRPSRRPRRTRAR